MKNLIAIPILYVHHERALGGAPLSLLYLLRKLDRAKYAPRVICLREGPAADLFRRDGIPVQVLAGPDLSHTELVWFRWWQFPRLLWRILASISLFLRLRKAMNDSAFHVPRSPFPLVHLNSSTLAVAALAAKSLGLPVVWHIREPLARGYLGFRRALLRLVVRRLADQVIAISRNDADQLGSMSSLRLSVIHNFVDFKQFDAGLQGDKIRVELGIPPDHSVVLFLGGGSPVKGTGVLLDAATKIFSRSQSIHFVIAGEGSSANPSDERIHRLGPRLDVPDLLAGSDLLVFPSIIPHFARPVIEAAAMAKPVVASDLGGVRELVVHGETGLLIPPGNPDALASAVIELLANPARRKKMGGRARALAREKFNADKNAVETFMVYERMARPV